MWQIGRAVSEADIALHFNPRLDQNKVVLNDRKGGQWGQEEYQPLIVMQDDSSAVKVFNPGLTTQILIKCEASHFQVSTEATFSYSFFFFFLFFQNLWTLLLFDKFQLQWAWKPPFFRTNNKANNSSFLQTAFAQKSDFSKILSMLLQKTNCLTSYCSDFSQWSIVCKVQASNQAGGNHSS